MEAIRDYSQAELAALTNDALDALKLVVREERYKIQVDRPPAARAELLRPTDSLLARMKQEYARRNRQF